MWKQGIFHILEMTALFWIERSSAPVTIWIIKLNVTNITLALLLIPLKDHHHFQIQTILKQQIHSTTKCYYLSGQLITQTYLLPFSSIYSSASLRLKKKKINFIWAPQMQVLISSIANCNIKADLAREQSMQCMIICSCGIPALHYLSFSVTQFKFFELNRLHQNFS